MVFLRLGRWNTACGRFLVWKRVWLRGYIWTPFCRVRLRRR